MHRLILLAALLLAACAGPGPKGAAAFRDATAPIWSAAAFQPGQIAGTWAQVAGFQAGGAKACDAGAVEFQPVAQGLEIRGNLCLNGVMHRVSGLARPMGPGRLSVAGQEDWWVLWVDSGYRTLAIGTPSGKFGFVLDRSALPQDRLTAAREVFDFNGYGAGTLQAF